MVKTQLPTKSDYDLAVDELRKLNEDIFYDDFKKKIGELEGNILGIAVSNSNDFKEKAENIMSRASMLFRQMEQQQKEMKGHLDENQKDIIQNNQDFLEVERTRLLFVYEELKKSIQVFNETSLELQQNVAVSNKDLLDQTLLALGTVSNDVTEFTQKISESDERNKQFLQQNEAFVTLTKEQLAVTEGKIASHVAALQEMDLHLSQLQKLYEDMFHKHTSRSKLFWWYGKKRCSTKSLINSITGKRNNSLYFENMKLDVQQWQEQMETQSKKNYGMLQSISDNMTSKENLANFEKKNKFKLNLLVSIVAIEAIIIGLNYLL